MDTLNPGINHSQTSEVQPLKDIETLQHLYTDTAGQAKFEIGRILYKRYKESGNISASVMLLNELKELEPSAKFIGRELQISLDKLLLLHDPIYIVKLRNRIHKKIHKNFKRPIKVLHVLNSSIPYLKNGYSIRSKYVVENQKKLGMDPVVLTKPGFPNDFYTGSICSGHDLIIEWENLIRYFRCLPKLIMRYTPLKTYLREYAIQIATVIDSETPDILQAASNYVNGLAALEAAWIKNIPFVYEIRGFWELTTLSKEPLFRDSEEFRLAQKMETFLANQANRVITISEGLRSELIKRGVAADKIRVIPNGVDIEVFAPKPVNQDLRQKYNPQDSLVIGYIGSITKYEGLQQLLPVIGKLKAAGYKLKLIIVGNGDYRPTLERLVIESDLSPEVFFVDSIAHEQAPEYYSLFDICAFPRIDEAVTQLVTPLKLIEAMACGKPIISSELAAIKEIVIPGENGLLFDNTEADLFQKLKLLYENPGLRMEMKTKAREWVMIHRDWNKLAKIYQSLYQEMM